MSLINSVTGSNYTSGSIERGESSTQLNTGALRRKYNFGDYVSELALAQDPFFRFVSMVSKKPTDDPSFKFTEKRSSYTKRYAYLADFDASAGSSPATTVSGTGNDLSPTVGTAYTFSFFTDYHNNGNKQNIYGQTVDYFEGVKGTQPLFFIPGQVIKIPHGAASTDNNTVSELTGYTLWKINSVDLDTYGEATTANSATINKAIVNATCVKAGANISFMSAVSASNAAVEDGAAGLGVAASNTTKSASQEDLEPFKTYVVGTAFDAGTGYPETWQDQPYSTGYGQTQIFKTSAVMNNTDRATVLKYEGNEWARIWKEKLIEHKWDIENAMLFGTQQSTVSKTTQGAVDFISTYGNTFSLSLATKSQDAFLDDMSALLDPRYNNAASTVFFCSTAVYNWLHKLSGYFANNVSMVQGNTGGLGHSGIGTATNSLGRADVAMTGKKKVFGIDISTISTPFGDMNVARNVHLDGTTVKMLGINMKYCAYRPLVGNGINRDTAVYIGVQTLENSGVDRRVDQILTEAGMEWCCPETHAIWT
tara:strand:- start:13553 stop:15163 length:1611 start_codon:yes stop_codon:yes gene_type:complete